ncbi:MAG: LysM peptidoglycan-binding domain-containing protein [Chloroflexi bacterium]|nr:LysM peptidoglycan-binding domain-containing protein [Chloroflexota bacterium]
MECYACGEEANQRCLRCGNAYCPDHGRVPSAGGQAFCADCLSPAGAAPSGAVFRGSLLALLVGAVLALWLLIRPPELPGESSNALQPLPDQPIDITPTPSPLSPATPTPRPEASATPKPKRTATPKPKATKTPSFFEYTVQEGDTLYDIATAYGMDPEDLAAINGIDDPSLIQPGDVIRIPD